MAKKMRDYEKLFAANGWTDDIPPVSGWYWMAVQQAAIHIEPAHVSWLDPAVVIQARHFHFNAGEGHGGLDLLASHPSYLQIRFGPEIPVPPEAHQILFGDKSIDHWGSDLLDLPEWLTVLPMGITDECFDTEIERDAFARGVDYSDDVDVKCVKFMRDGKYIARVQVGECV